MQNMSITFPDDRFTLTDVGLSVSSKLSIRAVKSTFSIEEDTTDIPCATNNDSGPTKMLSMRVPPEVTESLTLTLKRSTVVKSETLKLSFSYSVRTPQGFIPCNVTPHISPANCKSPLANFLSWLLVSRPQIEHHTTSQMILLRNSTCRSSRLKEEMRPNVVAQCWRKVDLALPIRQWIPREARYLGNKRIPRRHREPRRL